MEQNNIGIPDPSIESVLGSTEKQYYEQLFEYCTRDQIKTDLMMLVSLIKDTLLEKRVLAEVWPKYCNFDMQNEVRLNKSKFFTLLRALALYQANIPPESHKKYLLMHDFAYLPIFSKVPLPTMPMPPMTPQHS